MRFLFVLFTGQAGSVLRAGRENINLWYKNAHGKAKRFFKETRGESENNSKSSFAGKKCTACRWWIPVFVAVVGVLEVLMFLLHAMIYETLVAAFGISGWPFAVLMALLSLLFISASVMVSLKTNWFVRRIIKFQPHGLRSSLRFAVHRGIRSRRASVPGVGVGESRSCGDDLFWCHDAHSALWPLEWASHPGSSRYGARGECPRFLA